MRGMNISRQELHRLWATDAPPPSEEQLVFVYNAFRHQTWHKRIGRLVRLECPSGLSPSTKSVIVRVHDVTREDDALRVRCWLVWRTGLHDKYAEGVLDFLDGVLLVHESRVRRLERACEELQNKLVEVVDRLDRAVGPGAAGPPPTYSSANLGVAAARLPGARPAGGSRAGLDRPRLPEIPAGRAVDGWRTWTPVTTRDPPVGRVAPVPPPPPPPPRSGRRRPAERTLSPTIVV